MIGDPLCIVCTPALCVHGEQSPSADDVYQASIGEQLLAVTKERDALREQLADLERSVLQAYRRSKKRTGYRPRKRKAVTP